MRRPAGLGPAGFTLVEVLIGVGIMALVGLMAAALLRLGAVTGAANSTRSALLQEAQITQQIIAGRLSEAVWVFPNAVAATPATVLASSGETTLNTAGASGGRQWRPSYDPFVAMVLPPRGPGTACTTNEEGNLNSEGCYRYFAYYAVKRTTLAESAVLAASSKPKTDAANPDSWVLMEYRANLYDSSGAWVPNFNSGALTSNVAGPFYQGRAGRLLADYVAPDSVSFCVTPPTEAFRLGGRVSVQFNMQRQVQGTTQAVKDSPFQFSVTPRNWRTATVLAAPATACP